MDPRLRKCLALAVKLASSHHGQQKDSLQASLDGIGESLMNAGSARILAEAELDTDFGLRCLKMVEMKAAAAEDRPNGLSF
jgi:hypothetical protein